MERGLEELEIGGRIGTIQTIALLKSSRIMRRDLETKIPVQDHQQTLVSKTRKEDKHDDNNKLKIGDHSLGWSKGSFFNSYYTEV